MTGGDITRLRESCLLDIQTNAYCGCFHLEQGQQLQEVVDSVAAINVRLPVAQRLGQLAALRLVLQHLQQQLDTGAPNVGEAV